MTAETLLESWNDTPARRAITAFVQAASGEGSPGFVPQVERVAVFDNDGTLWSEKPIPIQLDFTLFRMAELAGRDPSLKDRQPYKAANRLRRLVRPRARPPCGRCGVHPPGVKTPRFRCS